MTWNPTPRNKEGKNEDKKKKKKLTFVKIQISSAMVLKKERKRKTKKVCSQRVKITSVYIQRAHLYSKEQDLRAGTWRSRIFGVNRSSSLRTKALKANSWEALFPLLLTLFLLLLLCFFINNNNNKSLFLFVSLARRILFIPSNNCIILN